MAENSDPTLYTRRAKRGTGASAVEGVCMITRSKVKWQPSDPSKAESAVIDVGAITREYSWQCCRRRCQPAAAAASAATEHASQPSHPRSCCFSRLQARSRHRASLSSSWTQRRVPWF